MLYTAAGMTESGKTDVVEQVYTGRVYTCTARRSFSTPPRQCRIQFWKCRLTPTNAINVFVRKTNCGYVANINNYYWNIYVSVFIHLLTGNATAWVEKNRSFASQAGRTGNDARSRPVLTHSFVFPLALAQTRRVETHLNIHCGRFACNRVCCTVPGQNATTRSMFKFKETPIIRGQCLRWSGKKSMHSIPKKPCRFLKSFCLPQHMKMRCTINTKIIGLITLSISLKH